MQNICYLEETPVPLELTGFWISQIRKRSLASMKGCQGAETKGLHN